METDKIREAILAKAKGEADTITAESEAKAREMIAKAKDQKKQRFEEEKNKIISEAQREASKIRAQASLQARQGILKEKDTILNMITDKVRKELSQLMIDKESFLPLVTEAIEAFETDESLRLYVAPKDISVVQEIINNESHLKEKIFEVKEFDCLGGVYVESKDGTISIDNTYDMRLEMLMPKILPEIGKKLFGDE